MKKRKTRSTLTIFDLFGSVLHRAYVDKPEDGLRGANLEGLQAPYGQLQGLDLTRALLYAARLRDADLSFAKLTEADLRGAALERAKCHGTSFRNANLGIDNLGGRSTLQGADLMNAVLTGATLVGAVYDDSTQFPAGFSPAAAGMIHADDLPANDLHRRQ